MVLLAILILLSPRTLPVDPTLRIVQAMRFVQFAQAVTAQKNSDELKGMAYVESTFQYGVRSPYACCYLGVRGGKYGNPSCDMLEASPWTCVMAAQWNIAYFRLHCGKSYLDAYNGGWKRCCDGPYYRKRKNTQEFSCSTSYSGAVRKYQRKFKQKEKRK